MACMVAGTSPKELLARVKKLAERVRQAQARAACRRAAIEQQSLRRHKKYASCLPSLPPLVQQPLSSKVCTELLLRTNEESSCGCSMLL
jgi:hypothetical protein